MAMDWKCAHSDSWLPKPGCIMQSKILLMVLCGFVVYRTILESEFCRKRYTCVKVCAERPWGIIIVFFLMGVFLFNSLHTWIIILDSGFMNPAQLIAENSDERRNLPAWLRNMALGTPIAIVVIYITTICHSLGHAKTGLHLSSGGVMSMKRQRVIQVLLLPLVYSNMAMQSVLLLLELMLGNEYRGMGGSWDDKKDAAMIEYEANFDTADFYEAYALHLFCRLVLDELKSWARRDRLRFQMADHWADHAVNQELILGAMAELSTIGVDTFVWTSGIYAMYSVLQACYSLTPTALQLPFLVSDTMHDYLFGAGFITSCTAITNVVKLERQFEESLSEENFGANKKFWSVKVLVSIAFLQKIAIKSIASGGYFGDLQQNLLYSTLICYELLFIAVLHTYAWPSDESWINKAKVKVHDKLVTGHGPGEQGKEPGNEPLLGDSGSSGLDTSP